MFQIAYAIYTGWCRQLRYYSLSTLYYNKSDSYITQNSNQMCNYFIKPHFFFGSNIIPFLIRDSHRPSGAG